MSMSFPSFAVVIFASCVLLSCSTAVKAPVAPQTANVAEASGFALVAGTWRLSHLGPSSVQDGRLPDPASALKKGLVGTTIHIQETGKIALMAPQHASSWQATINADSPLYLKIGSEDEPRERDWVYDKSSQLLMMPVTVNLGGKSGTIPVYFKRSK